MAKRKRRGSQQGPPQHPNEDIALGYVRVSTVDQGRSGLSLADQADGIERTCQRKGWKLLKPLYTDVQTGKSTVGRDGLQEALAALARREAGHLVVNRMNRFARSLRDLIRIEEQSRLEGWGLTIVDLDIDTSTPTGRFIFHILGAAAELDGGMISEQTKSALAQIPRVGTHSNSKGELKRGPGRPRLISHDVRQMIMDLHEHPPYLSADAIAWKLEGMKIRSPGGDDWSRHSVRKVILTTRRDRIREHATKMAAAKAETDSGDDQSG